MRIYIRLTQSLIDAIYAHSKHKNSEYMSLQCKPRLVFLKRGNMVPINSNPSSRLGILALLDDHKIFLHKGKGLIGFDLTHLSIFDNAVLLIITII